MLLTLFCFGVTKKKKNFPLVSQKKKISFFSYPLREMKTLKKVGLFGGAFDPPALHHVSIAKFLLHHRILDHVVFIPCYHSHYDKKMAPFQNRVQMCQLATKGAPECSVSDVEQQMPCLTETYDIVVKLLHIWRRPSTQYYFILGLDNAIKMDSWPKGPELRQLIPFLIINREGVESETPAKSPLWFLQNPHQFVTFKAEGSSSLVRASLKTPKTDKVEDLDPLVQAYIVKHRLYQI
jgi:nicotinate-nucleotide adenylyltransferase